ncbi:hypothetical protein H0H92_013574 [Tricholoma furcatifolium]|nr:hypothetical protein H0H92_013574 [Tricholoma furcatifolium]
MFTAPFFVVSLLAALASHVSCGPAETNGQRMARGLPPLPPKFGRTVPGKRDPWQPTPAWGCLEVRNASDIVLGRVKNTNSSSTIGGLSLSVDDGDLKVSFDVPQSGPFDILATNPQFSEPYYVGAAGTSDVDTLDLANPDTIAFTNVQQTSPNSIPVLSTYNSTLVVESALWSFNSQTGQLTAQYINPDGSLPSTVLAYDDQANNIFFVGDIDAYNAINNNPAAVIAQLERSGI